MLVDPNNNGFWAQLTRGYAADDTGKASYEDSSRTLGTHVSTGLSSYFQSLRCGFRVDKFIPWQARTRAAWPSQGHERRADVVAFQFYPSVFGGEGSLVRHAQLSPVSGDSGQGQLEHMADIRIRNSWQLQ